MISSRPHLHTNIIFKVITVVNIQENRNKYLESNFEKINHCHPDNYHKRWKYSHLIAEETLLPTECYTDIEIISKETRLTLFVSYNIKERSRI